MGGWAIQGWEASSCQGVYVVVFVSVGGCQRWRSATEGREAVRDSGGEDLTEEAVPFIAASTRRFPSRLGAMEPRIEDRPAGPGRKPHPHV